jgi:hypothetical protein
MGIADSQLPAVTFRSFSHVAEAFLLTAFLPIYDHKLNGSPSPDGPLAGRPLRS